VHRSGLQLGGNTVGHQPHAATQGVKRERERGCSGSCRVGAGVLRAASMARERLRCCCSMVTMRGRTARTLSCGRIAAINAGKQRGDEAVDGSLAEVAAGHLGDGFILDGGSGGKDISRAMRSLVDQEKSRVKAVGQQPGRNHEHQAVGERDEAVLYEDVGFALAVVGGRS